jgi:hypothetical protein
MLYVMVSLDLANAKKDRPDFNKLLADKGWVKLSSVDTVWSILFPKANETNYQLIVDVLAKTLLEAAKELKLDQISYVAQIGNAETIGRYVIKKNGVYKAGEFNPRKPAVNFT